MIAVKLILYLLKMNRKIVLCNPKVKTKYNNKI